MAEPTPAVAPGLPDGLPAQLLLLAVGERARTTTRGDVRLLVAAAAVAEELLANRRLSEVVDLSAGDVEAHLVERAEDAMATTTAALVAAGRLRPHTHRVLGLVPRHGWAVTDAAVRTRVEQLVVAALVPGRSVSTRDAVLATLAAVSGLARQHVRPRSAQERQALRSHLNSLAAGLEADLLTVVRGLRRAYHRTDAHRSGDSGVLLVPGSDRDGFGDQGGDGSGDGGGGADGGGDGGGGGGGD